MPVAVSARFDAFAGLAALNVLWMVMRFFKSLLVGAGTISCDRYAAAALRHQRSRAMAGKCGADPSRSQRYLQIYQRLLLLWDVIAHAMSSVLPFICIFFLILMAFAFSGHWVFGSTRGDRRGCCKGPASGGWRRVQERAKRGVHVAHTQT